MCDIKSINHFLNKHSHAAVKDNRLSKCTNKKLPDTESKHTHQIYELLLAKREVHCKKHI